MTEAKSADTDVRQDAREAYDRGVSPRRIMRRYNLSPGEMKEIAPEAFPEETGPDGQGGY